MALLPILSYPDPRLHTVAQAVKAVDDRIRGLISEGQVEDAARLLGRLASVDGIVVHGDKRGREIGFPTANLDVVPGQQLPAEGVYAGWATLMPGEQRFPAAISVGRNPHFGDVDDLRVEAHLLDYDGDEIYDRPLRLDFLDRKSTRLNSSHT